MLALKFVGAWVISDRFPFPAGIVACWIWMLAIDLLWWQRPRWR
jgi:hypothetical protein